MNPQEKCNSGSDNYFDVEGIESAEEKIRLPSGSKSAKIAKILRNILLNIVANIYLETVSLIVAPWTIEWFIVCFGPIVTALIILDLIMKRHKYSKAIKPVLLFVLENIAEFVEYLYKRITNFLRCALAFIIDIFLIIYSRLKQPVAFVILFCLIFLSAGSLNKNDNLFSGNKVEVLVFNANNASKKEIINLVKSKLPNANIIFKRDRMRRKTQPTTQIAYKDQYRGHAIMFANQIPGNQGVFPLRNTMYKNLHNRDIIFVVGKDLSNYKA